MLIGTNILMIGRAHQGMEFSLENPWSHGVELWCPIWMAHLFEDLGINVKLPILEQCDNLSMIAMTKKPMFYSRTKHIDICHHFMRDLVEDGFIQFYHYLTDDQIEDIFTKMLPKDHFFYLWSQHRV